MLRVRTSMRVSVSRSPKRIAGGAAFTPASLSNLVATISVAQARATGRLWQDAGKTVPATANNDPVRVAVCPFTSVEFTAPSDAARPLLFDEGGGKWSMSFDGVNDRVILAGILNARPYTVGVRYITPIAVASGRIVAGDVNNWLLGAWGAGGNVPTFFAGDFVGTSPASSFLPATSLAVANAGGASWWHNGTSRGSNAAATTPPNGLTVGGTATEIGVCRISGVVAYSADHTSSRPLLETYLDALL